MTNSSKLVAVAPLILGVLLALGASPGTAHAAVPAPITPQPTPYHHYTARSSELPLAPAGSLVAPGESWATEGGWLSKPYFVATGHNSNHNFKSRPGSCQLSEPYRTSDFQIRVDSKCDVLPENRSDYQPSRYAIGYNLGSGSSIVRCLDGADKATTEWTTLSQWTTRSVSGGQEGRFVTEHDYGTGITQWTASACVRFATIEMQVCPYIGRGTDGFTYTCKVFVWSAEVAATQPVKYGPKPDPEVELCKKRGQDTSVECLFINPGDVDGTDFDTVCQGAPTAAWLDFNWLPSFIGHYASCMFRPVNGWDQKGTLAKEIDDSAVGDIGQVGTETVDSFAFSEDCGILFSTGNSKWLPGFAVNSCTWSQWGAVKTIAALMITAFGGFWILRFVVATLTGIFSRKTPNPLGEGDA